MAEVWKYQLTDARVQEINIPRGARILTLQMQDGVPTMWALGDPRAPLEARLFCVTGTKHHIDISERDTYIGTFQLGWYVGHVFESANAQEEQPG